MGRKTVTDYLRQVCRPYLFSNAISSCVAIATIRALEMIEKNQHHINKLMKNASKLR